jgi:hypothetical protein
MPNQIHTNKQLLSHNSELRKKNVFYGSLRRWKQKDCEFRFLGYTVKGCPQKQGFGDVIQ